MKTIAHRMRGKINAALLLLLASCATDTANASLACTASATSVVFGTYDPLAVAPLDSAGSVSISCDLTFPSAASKVNYSFSLSAGVSGSMLARYMESPPNQLNYDLYTSNAYSQIWGDGSAGTANVSGSMKLGSPGSVWSKTDTYTVFGRIVALQDALPGNYFDTIIVTVTY